MAKIFKVVFPLLVIFVCAYLGAHFWIRSKNTVHDDVTKVGRLVECEPNSIRNVEITNPGGDKMVFERVDQAAPGTPAAMAYSQADWRYRAPLVGEADATLVRRVVSSACEIWDPVLVRASTTPEALRKVVLGLEGGKTISLELGAAGADRLVPVRSVEQGGEVRTAKIPDLLLQAVSRPAMEFRSRMVVRMDADNVQQATLKIDGKERFTLERTGADWTVLAGGKKLGEGNGASKFVNRIATLRALDVLEPDYGAKDCRNLKAKAELDLRGIAGREETVIFDYGRGGDIAACSTARNMKFRVHRDLVKYLDVSAKSLLTN